jgi:hypothetical protein
MRRLLFGAIACFAILLCGMVGFFAYHNDLARTLSSSEGFTKPAANAVKHAYAASQIYHALRMVGYSPDSAETITLQLGYANEHAEQVVKIHNPDSLREAMRDLYNNQVGIVVARWHESTGSQMSIYALLSDLARTDVLITSRSKVPIDASEETKDTEPVAEHAVRWFETARATIRLETLQLLAQ